MAANTTLSAAGKPAFTMPVNCMMNTIIQLGMTPTWTTLTAALNATIKPMCRRR